jgi:hypothetical protein
LYWRSAADAGQVATEFLGQPADDRFVEFRGLIRRLKSLVAELRSENCGAP